MVRDGSGDWAGYELPAGLSDLGTMTVFIEEGESYGRALPAPPHFSLPASTLSIVLGG